MLPWLDILRKAVARVDGQVDPGVAGVVLFGGGGGGEGLAVKVSGEARGRGVPASEHAFVDEAACVSFVMASLVMLDCAAADWSCLPCPAVAALSSSSASLSSSAASPDPFSENSASTMRSMHVFTPFVCELVCLATSW